MIQWHLPRKFMKSTPLIIESLKSHLKLRGLSYRDLARVWKLSQSSVKRVMSSGEVSLARIEEACKMMDLPLGDFYRQVPFEKQTDLVYLSAEQENKLSKDSEALHYFLLVQQGWIPSDIVRLYTISKEKNIQLLNQLERWGLLEVHPQNRIKRKFLGQLRFRKEGPLGRQIEKQVKTQFLESDFQKENEYFTFLTLSLIPGDPQKLKIRILEFFQEILQESEENREHPNSQDYGLVLAMRPWESTFTKTLLPRKPRRS
jgi:hypothetical protein